MAHLHTSQEALVANHMHSSLVLLECPLNMAADPKENKEKAAFLFMT